LHKYRNTIILQCQEFTAGFYVMQSKNITAHHHFSEISVNIILTFIL
jgi:hypothetical protein